MNALSRFLARRGWEAESIDAVEAFYRPGRSLVVRFRARARQGSGDSRCFILSAETRPTGSPPPPSSLGPYPDLHDPQDAVGPLLVWAFPHDPGLPGLGRAVHPPTVLSVLSPSQRAALDVGVVRYRPRRRAVLRYQFQGCPPADSVLFAKVFSPGRAEHALAAVRALDADDAAPLRLALPRPGPSPGTLILRPVEGRPLQQLLADGERLPSPARIAAIPAELAARAGADAPLLASARGRVRREAVEAIRDLLVHLVPPLRASVGGILDTVVRGLEDGAVADEVVHGDLHASQVLVDDEFRLGLIDLDDLGLGDPLLEAANFSAYLLVSALSAPRSVTGRLLAYRALLRRAFLDRLGAPAAALVWREAFTVLLLAPGPFRALHRSWPAQVQARVELAQRLLAERPG